MRVNDPVRGDQERLDILNLMRVVGVTTVEEASICWRVFSRTAVRPPRNINFC